MHFFLNLNIFAYKKNKNLSEKKKHCNKLRSFKAASLVRCPKNGPFI